MKTQKILKTIAICLTFTLCYNNCQAKELPKIEEETKYFKTTYNKSGIVLSTEEVSPQEYKRSQTGLVIMSSNLVTEYKMITLSNLNKNITLELKWQKNPYIQSHDVIAIRGENISFLNGQLRGTQTCNINGTQKTANYKFDTTNTKIFNNGVGISMNLFDNCSNYKLSLTVPYTGSGKAYGNYQHATRNVTLTQSQSYTLSSNGYGKVIDFDNSVRSYYDGMDGVSLNV